MFHNLVLLISDIIMIFLNFKTLSLELKENYIVVELPEHSDIFGGEYMAF